MNTVKHVTFHSVFIQMKNLMLTAHWYCIAYGMFVKDIFFSSCYFKFAFLRKRLFIYVNANQRTTHDSNIHAFIYN